MKRVFIKSLFLLSIFLLPNLVQAYEDGVVVDVVPKQAFNYDDYQKCMNLSLKCPQGEDDSDYPVNDMCVLHTLNSNSVCASTFNLIKNLGIDYYLDIFNVRNLGFNFFMLFWSPTLADLVDALDMLLTPNMQIISLEGVINPNWAEVKQKLKLPADRSPTFSVFDHEETAYFDNARSAITVRVVIPIIGDQSLNDDLFGYMVALLKFSPSNELQKVDLQYLDKNKKPIT